MYLFLCRRTQGYVSTLSDRTNAANSWGANYFVSIHINAGGGTGFESFVYPGVGTPTTTYQSTIHNEVMKLINYRIEGKTK